MNYHLFVVDEVSLKYHLEYMFVGTGKSSTQFDIDLWKDIVRLKPGDKIVFYVQKLKKFYGFFEVGSYPFFDNTHYLQPNSMPFLGDNQIKLQYRALIRPYQVFQYGIDEFQLVDILPQSSRDILWSVLYRKLKGERGCSPIFPHEFNIILQRIADINNNIYLNSNSFTFSNKQIIPTNQSFIYEGNRMNPNIKEKILNGNYKESHLHALLIEFFNHQLNFQWVGNEVYSGAGMQAMDILTIDNNNIFNIFEMKKGEIPKNITLQVEKYIYWLKNRFQCFNNNAYQPIIVGSMINRNHSLKKLQYRINEFNQFNNLRISLPIVYIEYLINYQNNTIDFYQFDYIRNTQNLWWSI
jgi:hypothetical protein